MKYPELHSLAVAPATLRFYTWGLYLDPLSKSGIKSTQLGSQIAKELCKSDVTPSLPIPNLTQTIKFSAVEICRTFHGIHWLPVKFRKVQPKKYHSIIFPQGLSYLDAPVKLY